MTLPGTPSLAYWIELAAVEKTPLALEPSSRIVPTTSTKMTANITAYCPGPKPCQETSGNGWRDLRKSTPISQGMRRSPTASARGKRQDLHRVFVGGTTEAKAFIGKGTRTFDAKQMTVVPGFIDCHNHAGGNILLYEVIVGNPGTWVTSLLPYPSTAQTRDIRSAAAGPGASSARCNW